MTRKSKQAPQACFKMFVPETFHDLEEIGEILQTYESSILVNLSKSKCSKEVIAKAMDFIRGYNTGYMRIRVNKVFTRVFTCVSCRNQLI